MATKPVIVGADGSRESLRAVEWAAREAALRGTSLRIVAVPPLPRRMTSTPATPGTVSDVVERSTSEALAAAAQ
jgi:nucleotide-binding universal stress UspA family protein